MVVVIDVQLKLTKVLMSKFAGFKVDKDVTLENCMVEHKIDVEMVAIQSQPLLS